MDKFGTGWYGVNFSQDVDTCAYVLSVGPTGTLGSPSGLSGFGEAGKSTQTTSRVIVNTYATSSATSGADRSFHLAVFC